MTTGQPAMTGSNDYFLVALSVVIAILASYTALDLAGRVTAASGWLRQVWLAGGAAAMGFGIWSMHYLGMLTFRLPVPVAYDWPTVMFSLGAALIASALALHTVSRKAMGPLQAVLGSLMMGSGIASMHYIGMAAMRLPAECWYDVQLVALSILIAVLASFAALWLAFYFRGDTAGTDWRKLAGSVALGVAIPAMHYTGMAAAHFSLSREQPDLSHAVNISTLGIAGIAAVTFVVLGLAGSLGGKWPLLFGITPPDISTHSRRTVCVQSDLEAKTSQRFSKVCNEQLCTAVVHRGNSNKRRSNQSNTHKLPSSDCDLTVRTRPVSRIASTPFGMRFISTC
jgi:NO-binding membrane sensor protein with MHYT domain